MQSADIAAAWAEYKVQIVVGLAVVLVSFVLFRTAFKLVRFALVLGIGAGIGIGAAYGLTQLGVPGRLAYWGAVLITLVALLLGARQRKSEG